MNDINGNNSKILFCVVGATNCGKTSVINNLYDLFKKNPSFKSTSYSTIDSDFSDIFTIQLNHKKTTVGIISAGDDDITIKSELKKFIQCDYIICVSRTKGKTRDAVENFANSNKFILRQINKSYFWKTNITQKYKSITANEEHYLNDFFSKLLYSLIDEYIKGII